LHYYEGHAPEVIVRPIQWAARLGARFAILTNAAGGIRDDLDSGTLMPVSGLLEWIRPDAWRKPPMPSPCSLRVLDRLRAAGGAWTAAPGTYATVSGPNYETPAEVRALRACRADAVGMSTNFELHAGAGAGMECGAISLVTNRAAGLSAETPNHEDVMA